MKKIVIVALFFLIANISVFAQQAGQFTFGGRAGMGIGISNPVGFGALVSDSFYPGQNYASSLENPEINFAFALYANFAITDRIAIQTEFNFMYDQGYELRFSTSAGSRGVDVDYSSIDIPLLVRFTLINSPAIFGVQAGPHISIPVGRLEIYEDLETNYQNERFRINSSFAFGVTAGLFAGFRAGPGRVVGDLRFVHDFNYLEATVQGNNVRFIERQAFVFTVGYEISL
ncbi:MAG: outer membrane beta-barrel protein [Treponema sp.]|nr:outer membrane beta-barrel protein [Treponema sp.]